MFGQKAPDAKAVGELGVSEWGEKVACGRIVVRRYFDWRDLDRN